MNCYIRPARSKRVGLAAAMLFWLPGTAWGQDCEEDADCGHGFQCIHDSAGTSSVTGSGGSSAAECGDGICDTAMEDIQSCPDDCDTLQYCAPAECASDDDCAEGYECGPEVGSNSATTGVGGSSSSECGDSICSFDESTDSCPGDCPVYRLCQVALVPCESNADCTEGFYCYQPGANSGGSAVSVASVDTSSASNDVASNGSDGSSVSSDGGGSGGTDSWGGDAAGDAAGQCVPEETGENSASSTKGATSTGGSGSGESNASATGADGIGGGSDSGGNSSATGNSSDSSAGGSSGGSDDDGGCSCSTPAQRGAPTGVSLLGLLVCVGVARRVRLGGSIQVPWL